MVVGFLHATFLSKLFMTRMVFNLSILLLLPVLLATSWTGVVYADEWFAVKGAGVLSGKSGLGVSNTNIPGLGSISLPFVSVLIQGVGVGAAPKPEVGSILVADDKSVESGGSDTEDAFLEGMGSLPDDNLFAILKKNAKTPPGSCENILMGNVLKPSDLVYSINAICLRNAIIMLDGVIEYGLDGDGIVILYVTGANLRINDNLRSRSPNQRLIIVSEARIRLSPNIGYTWILPSQYYTDFRPNIEASLVSLSNSSIDFTNTRRALIVEGPIYSKVDVEFQRNNESVPSAFIRYNPFYTAKLAEQLFNGTSKVPGLNVRWLYE